MSRQSYQNPHARHEGELADTYYRETDEILYNQDEKTNRRGSCLIVTAVAIVVLAIYLIIAGWPL